MTTAELLPLADANARESEPRMDANGRESKPETRDQRPATSAGVDYIRLTGTEVAAFQRCYLGKWPAERMHCCKVSENHKWQFRVPATHGAFLAVPPAAFLRRFDVDDGKATFEHGAARIESVCPYRVGQTLYISEPARIEDVRGDSFIIVRSDGTRKSVINRPELARVAAGAINDAIKAARMHVGKPLAFWPGILPRELAASDRVRVMKIGQPQLRSEMTREDFEAEGAPVSNQLGNAYLPDATIRTGWAEMFAEKFPGLARMPDGWVWPVHGQRVV